MSLLDNVKKQDANAQINKNAAPTPTPKPAAQSIEASAPDEAKTYDYATPHSDGLMFHFEDGSSVKSENGVMTLNQVQHNEIQRLIKKGRPDIAQQMVLTDKDAAEKVAREYLARQAEKKAAHQGASSTAIGHSLAKDMANQQVKNLDVQEIDITHGDDGDLGQQATKDPLANLNK